MNVMSTKTVVL